MRSRPESVSEQIREASPVFTTAHGTVGEAFRDFFGVRPEPVQPIAFSHQIHAANRIDCTSYCHTSVSLGPTAGIPGVKKCLICHANIAADRPEVKKIIAFEERGEDIPWQRVYGYPQSAHLKFNHAPHIRADVQCSACHGDLTKQTVATRAVSLTMGFCVDCHKTRSVSVECATCHY